MKNQEKYAPIRSSYHHGDLRRALLTTALDLLKERDDWNFTLREVARLAGVSHAAPYKHFADKKALIAALALHGFEELAEIFRDIQKRHSANPEECLAEMTRSVVAFAKRNTGLYRLMFSAEVTRNQFEAVETIGTITFEILTGLLERAQSNHKLVRTDIRAQAAACWAMAHGLAILTIDDQLTEDKVGPDPVEGAFRCLITGIGT